MNSKDSMTNKTAELDRELVRLNIDICAVSDIHEVEYTIFCYGKDEDEVRQDGVGLPAENSLIACINVPLSTSEHLTPSLCL